MQEMIRHYRDDHPRRWKAAQKARAQEREERSFLSWLLTGSDISIADVDPDEWLDDDQPDATQ
jgi:hypothetical protein